MATNPPVTIGELIDVPAPGSGVKSAWCQEVTRRSAHRFATGAARDAAYAAAGAGVGALCVTVDTGTPWIVVPGPPIAWQAVPVVTPWVGVPWANGWADLGGGPQTVQYRKEGDRVFVRGLGKGGTSGTVAWTFPVGFRPLALQRFGLDGAGSPPSAGYGTVTIATAGTATISCPLVTNVAIEFSFSTVA